MFILFSGCHEGPEHFYGAFSIEGTYDNLESLIVTTEDIEDNYDWYNVFDLETRKIYRSLDELVADI